MVANNNCPQYPPLNDQVPNYPRLEIENPLGLPEHLPQQEMTPLPVAPDENIDNFLGLYYRVDVEALNDWATVTHFMKGSIGFEIQEPEIWHDNKVWLQLKEKGPELSDHDNRTVICADYWMW